jgi:hypothetical protein
MTTVNHPRRNARSRVVTFPQVTEPTRSTRISVAAVIAVEVDTTANALSKPRARLAELLRLAIKLFVLGMQFVLFLTVLVQQLS